MHCPECEAFDKVAFDKTDLYLWFPLDHTFSKACALVGDGEYDYRREEHDILVITLSAKSLAEFLVEIGGELSTQELMATKALTLPTGDKPSIANLQRVTTLDKLLWSSHGAWLQDMVEQERFTTYFQPIVKNGSHQVVGHEALFRGLETDGALISPGHIFRTAREAGQLFQLDLVARRSAVQQAAAKNLKDQWLFINFNPTAVYDPSYCLRTTVSACEDLGLRPENIVFEVTETEQVKDVRHLRGILSFYRKAGFRVALDDVGAGYSGLNILQTLSPDLIKIDRHLVEDIHQDRFKQNIVQHLSELAYEQDISVLAEGIESPEEAAFLGDLRVDYLQGYHFGRPEAAPLQTLEKRSNKLKLA